MRKSSSYCIACTYCMHEWWRISEGYVRLLMSFVTFSNFQLH